MKTKRPPQDRKSVGELLPHMALDLNQSHKRGRALCRAEISDPEKSSVLRAMARLLQILRVLARHKFLGAMLGRSHRPSPKEVRLAFEELGITFIKFGQVANVGVHGKSVELHLEKLWSSNITLATRLVDAGTTPMLLKMIGSGRLDAKKLVSHRFKLSEIIKAYDTFAHAARHHALKVIIKN